MPSTASRAASDRLRRSRIGAAVAVVLLNGFTPAGARAAFVPLFGAPGYVEGVGGYKSGFPAPTAINESGTAVGHEFSFDGAGVETGYHPVRWNGSGAAEALRDLGSGNERSSFTTGIAPAINAAGVVVGSAVKYDLTGSSKGNRAVRWDAAGTAIELEHLGTNGSGVTSGRARAINAAGVVAGTVDKYDLAGTNKGSRAVRWDAAGVVQELGTLSTKSDGFASSMVYAMNANNIVVGYGVRYDAGDVVKGTRAARWDASGAVEELSVNFGATDTGVSHSRAVAVNDAGVAVGYATKYSANGGFRGERAVRWDAAGAGLELGNLGVNASGTTHSHANAISAVGVAVGSASKYDAGGNSKGQRAVRWDATGAVEELGTLGTSADGITTGEAYALNSAGVAVGYTSRYRDDGSVVDYQAAVYWDAAGKAFDLNELIDPASGWYLSYANAVTENGWIAGIGVFDPDGNGPAKSYLRLFSMQVPGAAVPEPSVMSLIGVSVIACVVRRRPRRPGCCAFEHR